MTRASGDVRVLVLEDEPLIAMLVVDILTDAGLYDRWTGS